LKLRNDEEKSGHWKVLRKIVATRRITAIAKSKQPAE
jgi:hypothetical protein